MVSVEKLLQVEEARLNQLLRAQGRNVEEFLTKIQKVEKKKIKMMIEPPRSKIITATKLCNLFQLT